VTRPFFAAEQDGTGRTLKAGEQLFASYPIKSENGFVTFEVDNWELHAPEEVFRNSTVQKNPV